MARRLYPIGIQTFERIRHENKMYVDKTAYVYRITHYADAFAMSGKQVVKVGIGFNVEQERNITDWIAEPV